MKNKIEKNTHKMNNVHIDIFTSIGDVLTTPFYFPLVLKHDKNA